MILKVKKNYPDAKLPTRANESDAGLDVYAHSYKIVGEKLNEHLWKRIDYIEYDCGVSIRPRSEWISALGGRQTVNYFTYLAPRSSISKTNLIQANGYGLIDAGFTGSLLIRYKYHAQPTDYVFFSPDKWPSFGIQIDESKIYAVGDKIGQLIVTEQHPVYISEEESLEKTDRGTNGFGSSGT